MMTAYDIRRQNHEDRLKRLNDIDLLVGGLRGPCSYNPAAFTAEHLAKDINPFWYGPGPCPKIEELEAEKAKQEANKISDNQVQRALAEKSLEEKVEAILQNMEGNAGPLQDILDSRAELDKKYGRRRV